MPLEVIRIRVFVALIREADRLPSQRIIRPSVVKLLLNLSAVTAMRNFCTLVLFATKCRVSEKPRQCYSHPTHPHGNNPAADGCMPVEEEAQGVERCNDQEDGSGDGIESFLSH